MLSNSLHIQIYHIQGVGFLDVDAVDAGEGVGYLLAAIGSDGVGDAVGDNIHRHAALDAHAIAILAQLYCDTI